MSPVIMEQKKARISAPLAACGAILAALALVGLARGYDDLEPEPVSTAPAPTPDAGPPPDAGLSSEQLRRLLEERPMDVNRATATELELLPRIGPVLGQRVVADRDANGPFRSVGDLQRVRGIGPATVEGIAPLATVELPDAGVADAGGS